MSRRESFNTSVVSAAATKAATVSAAPLTAQVTIDAANSVIGYNLQAANTPPSLPLLPPPFAKANSLFAAEQAKQAAVAVARDTLRKAGGDLAPF